jgi:hypothetical protein
MVQPIEGEPLLPGENRGSRFVDDAEHWISVYREFIRFKEGLLSTVETERAELSEELSAALSVSVVSQLTDQYASLQRRLTFWRDRLAELTQRT